MLQYRLDHCHMRVKQLQVGDGRRTRRCRETRRGRVDAALVVEVGSRLLELNRKQFHRGHWIFLNYLSGRVERPVDSGRQAAVDEGGVSVRLSSTDVMPGDMKSGPQPSETETAAACRCLQLSAVRWLLSGQSAGLLALLAATQS